MKGIAKRAGITLRRLYPWRRVRLSALIVLVAGFGGMLVIMVVAAIYSSRISRELQDTNAQMRQDYVFRARTLGEIRQSLYESGNIVRDYILVDNGQGTAETLRRELKELRDEMDEACKAYANSLRTEERGRFDHLYSEVENYWSALVPVFEWDASTKRGRGYAFLRQEVFPQRSMVLTIAREISEVNDSALKENEKRISDVFNRSQRRLQLITATGLSLGLIVAIAAVTYTWRLEWIAYRRYRESLRARDELKALSARIVTAQEEERRTISRELHDEVGQCLTALLMEIDEMAATPDPQGAFRKGLEKVKPLLENCINVVRDMSLLLRPSMLDDLGLVAALEWQAREVGKRTDLVVKVRAEEVADSLPEEHKSCVYRVSQEALSNCVRHAKATKVSIVVRQERGRLLLRIEDDGNGFDASRVRGLGLVGMSERVAHLRGKFEIESKQNRGTSIRIELPLNAGIVAT
jgi:signal transduction histidine kinase